MNEIPSWLVAGGATFLEILQTVHWTPLHWVRVGRELFSALVGKMFRSMCSCSRDPSHRSHNVNITSPTKLLKKISILSSYLNFYPQVFHYFFLKSPCFVSYVRGPTFSLLFQLFSRYLFQELIYRFSIK